MSTLEVATPFGYRLLTKKEVADFLSMTTRTIDRMVAADSIPHVYIPAGTGQGKRLRFISRDIEAWLGRQTVASGSYVEAN